MAAPIELTTENFDQLVLQNPDKPVLVDFWAVWCVPCQMVAPVVEAISEEMSESAVVGKLHIEDYPEIAERYNVMSIPTLLIFFKGELVKQFIGVQEREVLVTAMRDVANGVA
jgi:thioredoxin 1